MITRSVRSVGGAVSIVEGPVTGPEDWPVVHVAAAGICGSDLHLVAAGPTHVALGHELSGHLDDGTAVAVVPLLACGSCSACRDGQPQRCSDGPPLLGVTEDGGMADRVRVRPDCIRVLPPEVPVADACLAEPLAVAVHGVNRAGVAEGQRVLVVGAGAIGLCAVAVARHIGAFVDVAELHDERLERASWLGAAPMLAGGVDRRYDVVIDAAGTQGSLDLSVARCRPGGTIGLLACHWTPASIGLELQIKEVAIVPAYLYGSHRGADEFATALDLLRTPDVARALITHRLPLERAADAFALAATPAAVKVVLEPASSG